MDITNHGPYSRKHGIVTIISDFKLGAHAQARRILCFRHVFVLKPIDFDSARYRFQETEFYECKCVI